MTGENGIEIWGEKDCLLSLLSDHIARAHKNDLQDVVVVLPTQRLLTCLLAILGKKLEVFHPPKLYTLETFVREFGEDSSQVPVISDLVQELILGALVREKNYSHLLPGHEHEIKQFFNDIAEYDLGIRAFASMRDVISKDQHAQEQHVEHLIRRIEELEDLYQRFIQALQKHRVNTEAQAMAKWAKNCEIRFGSEKGIPFEHVYFSCFTTVKEYLKPLLSFLGAKKNCSIWFSQAPQLFGSMNPLANLIKSVSGKNHAKVTDKTPKKGGQAPFNGRIHQCSSLLAEVANAVDVVAEHLAQGVPPSKIGILLTQEGTYSKILRSTFAQKGIGANVAASSSLLQSPLGAWISLLIEVLEEGQVDAPEGINTKLRDFLLHPISLKFLMGQLKSRECEWDLLNLRKYVQEIFAAKRRIGRIDDLLPGLADESLKEGFAKISQLLQPFAGMGELPGAEKKLRLGEWCFFLDQICDEVGLWSQNLGEDEGVANSSIVALLQLIDDFKEASIYFDSFLTARDFWVMLQEKMAGLEIRSVGYPLQGVQILSLIESRYIPFQVIIILGCIEGQFPKSLPRDRLVDNWIKEKIGLPAWKYIEALEDTTFQLLVSRIPHIELSFPNERHDQLAVRSRFIEKILCTYKDVPYHIFDSNRVLELYQGPLCAQKSENIEEKQRSRQQTQGISVRDAGHFLSQVSATNLQSLFHCPYRYALKKFHVDRLGEELTSAVMEEGAKLHELLEVFMAGQSSTRKYCEALPQQILVQDWEGFCSERAHKITELVLPSYMHHSPLVAHLKRFSWPKFFSYLKKQSRLSQDQKYFLIPEQQCVEWKLGQGNGVLLKSKKIFHSLPVELNFLVSGIIDRVHVDHDSFHIIDYKRNNLPTKKEVETGLVPQLLLYALALNDDPLFLTGYSLSQVSLSYWSILKGRELKIAAGESLQELLLKLEPRNKISNLNSLLDNFIRKWEEQVHTFLVEKQSFKAQEGKDCRVCEFGGICRIKDPSVSPYMPQSPVNSRSKSSTSKQTEES